MQTAVTLAGMRRHRPACSSREAAEALQPMARCGDSSRLPPVCDRSSSWAKALVSNGSASAPLPRRRTLCVRAWVERFLCRLEPSVDSANLLPPNVSSLSRLRAHHPRDTHLAPSRFADPRHAWAEWDGVDVGSVYGRLVAEDGNDHGD